MKFKNRLDAAKHLLPLLKKYQGENTIIMAIPRGAVPIGLFLAEELHTGFQMLLIKKIGHPLNPELAIGAVSLNEKVIDPQFQVDPDYIEGEVGRIRELLKSRDDIYRTHLKNKSLKNKTVILLDDGIATGNTILAGIKLVKQQEPSKIVVASPVASQHAMRKIMTQNVELICFVAPEDFLAVGEHYEQFPQVSDEEVSQCIEKWNEEQLLLRR